MWIQDQVIMGEQTLDMGGTFEVSETLFYIMFRDQGIMADGALDWGVGDHEVFMLPTRRWRNRSRVYDIRSYLLGVG